MNEEILFKSIRNFNAKKNLKIFILIKIIFGKKTHQELISTKFGSDMRNYFYKLK